MPGRARVPDPQTLIYALTVITLVVIIGGTLLAVSAIRDDMEMAEGEVQDDTGSGSAG